MLSRVFRVAASQGAKNFSTSQPVSSNSGAFADFSTIQQKRLRNQRKNVSIDIEALRYRCLVTCC